MAVTTYTRRHIVDMLPEFLTKRSSGFGPLREAMAKEAGLSEALLMYIATVIVFAEGDIVLRERQVWRSPYALKRPSDAAGAEAVAAGLAEPVSGGWRLKQQTISLAENVQRALREHLRGLQLPADAVKRAADALEPTADGIPASAKRAALVHKLRPKADEPKADILRLNRAVAELWYFRDDCHIGAWQDAGYEGPVFDVLSYMWPGRPDMAFTKMAAVTSLDALAEALKAKQDRADVERAIAALEKRGDVTHDGDSVRLTPPGQKIRDEIEDETDRRFFAIWQLDDAATARLGEDLRAVIDAFPKS
jgi:hypothetical protein